MVYYIYKTTCLINGKMYVGKHKFNGEGQDKNYLGSGKLLWLAIKKYGKNNFIQEIIEFNDDEEQNCIRERYWIKTLNTMKPNGYNCSPGGEGGISGWNRETNKWMSINMWNSYTPEQRQKRIEKMIAGIRRPEVRKKIGLASKQWHASKTKEEHDNWRKKLSEGWTKEKREKAAKNIAERNKVEKIYDRLVNKYGKEEGEKKYEEWKQKISNTVRKKQDHIKKMLKKKIEIQQKSPDWGNWQKAKRRIQNLRFEFRKKRISEEEFDKQLLLLQKELKVVREKVWRFVDDWNNGKLV